MAGTEIEAFITHLAVERNTPTSFNTADWQLLAPPKRSGAGSDPRSIIKSFVLLLDLCGKKVSEISMIHTHALRVQRGGVAAACAHEA